MSVYGRIEDESTPSWTRSQEGVGRDNQEEFEESQQARLPFFRILIWSTLVVFVSAVVPFFLGLTSLEQVQDFYAAWAMNQGGEIYTAFYGTSGLLYYFLLSITKGSILFAVFNWLALLGAGVFLFRSGYALTEQNDQSTQALTVFYLLAGALSFGGGYATILALPFLFYSLDLVTHYLAEPDSDKGFLRIGMSLSLAFFLVPLTTILYSLVLFFTLLAFNLVRRYFARGFYQLLAIGLGFSLLFYPIGYYTVYKGSFGSAISQILYPIDSLNFISNSILVDNLLFYGLLVIGLGGLSFLFMSLFQPKPLGQYILSIFSLLGLLLELTLILFSTEPIHGSRLVSLLPFIVILVLTTLRVQDVDNSSRLTRYADISSMWSRYLTRTGYLPILAITYLLVSPFVSRYVIHVEQYQERARIETSIKSQTQATDKIYVWDNQSSSYQSSERLSASQLLSPILHMGLAENRTKLINDLRDNQPKVIVVNTKTALWTEVEQLLAENYQLLQGDFKEFKIYKLK